MAAWLKTNEMVLLIIIKLRLDINESIRLPWNSRKQTHCHVKL
jgi:hypothetical protein